MARPRLPDLVVDTKLKVAVFADHSVHTCLVSDPEMRRPRRHVEERWERRKLLGRGGFGQVWLEECVAGPTNGQVRAVKLIPNRQPGSQTAMAIDYSRELEAIAKFSQNRVRT